MRGLIERGGAFAEMLLMDGLSVAKAWDVLHDPETASQLDTEQYYETCLAAGFSKAAAEKAACDWGLQRLRSDRPV